MSENPLRHIPAVDQVLRSAPLVAVADRLGRGAVVAAVRTQLERLRAAVQDDAHYPLPSLGDLADEIAERLLEADQPALRRVVNATGILLHTGLGRAPLSQEAMAAMAAVAGQYASVEIDLETGRRSQRVAAVEPLLVELTGAEAAVVVNNNAAATLLALAAVAGQGREVIVSRGELIEIGGSFRLPDVMHVSGARLREVGTTNKTRLADYRDAIDENTAAMMLVNTSNYVVVGFTESVSLAALVALGRERDLPVLHDIGSGALIDLGRYGAGSEPTAPDSIRAGADLVLLSGDKLLGGPQCGIVVGRRKWIDAMARHPLMRALRVDRLTLSALGATLRAYRDPDTLPQHLPLMRLLATPLDALRRRAADLSQRVASSGVVGETGVVDDFAYLGGGSLPGKQLPTVCVWITPSGCSVDALARRLRSGQPSIVGRVREDRFLLDMRSVFVEQDADIAAALARL